MSVRPLPRKLNVWTRHLASAELPVLRRSMEEIARLKADEDGVSAQQMSATILHDPMMTLKVLQYLQTQRGQRHSADITTIEHAIMMLGVTRFLDKFGGMSAVEDKLAAYPEACEGALRVLCRARHASLYARDWAVNRHDVEPGEVGIAALLHDTAEMLIWCFAPEQAHRIHTMMLADPTLRSHDAQIDVLGFPLIDLQLALTHEWNLPALFLELMDDAHAAKPRVINVALAVRLARHSSVGWYNPALPDDYKAIGKFLGLPMHEVTHTIVRTTLAAARDWQWYNVPPAAAYLPLLPEPVVKTVPEVVGPRGPA